MISVSFFGLLLVGALALNPPTVRESFLWRKPLIGSLFWLICIFGILAIFFPKQCSAVFDFKKKEKHEHSDENLFAFHGTRSIVQGHHPDCENFSAHVLRIGDRRFCAACIGLLLGGLISLVGAFLYFFVGWSVGESNLQAVSVGLVGVSFGLFQFKVKRSVVRLVLNSFFVFGALLLLVGIDELAQSVFADLFLVILIVFWLFTRISLSQWNNWRICYTCNVASCEFHKSGEKRVELLFAAQPVESANED